MESTARKVYARLPERARRALRGAMTGARGDERDRWIRDVYTRYGMDKRHEVMLGIARFAHINRPIGGYYFEFGSHEATTMRMAYDTFHHLFDWTYVAFDSFEGLPEIGPIDRQPIWAAGKLKTAEDDFVAICTEHGIPREKLVTVKGFYDDSLNEETAARLLPTPAAVAYVDCDLYESTVPVLEFIVPFLQLGTVVVFDDWNCFHARPDRGERRAWSEFRQRHPELEFEPFMHTSEAQAFVCTRPPATRAVATD